MRADVIHGDCLDVMRGMPAMSVDSVVTDPPYGLAFMGKEWDHGVPASPFWAEALRVAKPGAALLAFGGTRTFHRLACAIEDAGWRIYDCLSWMHGQGFPKHRTHLKPAWEPIVFAAKKGARFVNVDGCRLATDVELRRNARGGANGLAGTSTYRIRERRVDDKPQVPGRWPANVVLDEEAARAVDEMSGDVRGCASVSRPAGGKNECAMFAPGPSALAVSYADSGGASRFFFVSEEEPCERNVRVASDAGIRCGSCGTATALSPARASRNREVSPRGPVSIRGSETSTRFQSRVSNAEPPDDIGIIPTTPIFCGLCGSVLRVTEERTRAGDAGRAGGGSDPASATRFLYSAKASRADRDEEMLRDGGSGALRDGGRTGPRGNHHPTVKPTDLMRWLCRLVTPPGGLVLDPFCGSGSTGVAANAEGFDFIGIEREVEYVEIARRRIANVAPLFAQGGAA